MGADFFFVLLVRAVERFAVDGLRSLRQGMFYRVGE